MSQFKISSLYRALLILDTWKELFTAKVNISGDKVTIYAWVTADHKENVTLSISDILEIRPSSLNVHSQGYYTPGYEVRFSTDQSVFYNYFLMNYQQHQLFLKELIALNPDIKLGDGLQSWLDLPRQPYYRTPSFSGSLTERELLFFYPLYYFGWSMILVVGIPLGGFLTSVWAFAWLRDSLPSPYSDAIGTAAALVGFPLGILLSMLLSLCMPLKTPRKFVLMILGWLAFVLLGTAVYSGYLFWIYGLI